MEANFLIWITKVNNLIAINNECFDEKLYYYLSCNIIQLKKSWMYGYIMYYSHTFNFLK